MVKKGKLFLNKMTDHKTTKFSDKREDQSLVSELTYRPELACLEQGDEELVKVVKEHYLVPPSKEQGSHFCQHTPIMLENV